MFVRGGGTPTTRGKRFGTVWQEPLLHPDRRSCLSSCLCCLYLGVWRRGLAAPIGGREGGAQEGRGGKGHIEELKVCFCCFFFLFVSSRWQRHNTCASVSCRGAFLPLSLSLSHTHMFVLLYFSLPSTRVNLWMCSSALLLSPLRLLSPHSSSSLPSHPSIPWARRRPVSPHPGIGGEKRRGCLPARLAVLAWNWKMFTK